MESRIDLGRVESGGGGGGKWFSLGVVRHRRACAAWR